MILLDEPFSALDTGLRTQTRQSVIHALDEAQVTTILVTHDQDEAMRFGHQIGVLEGGKLIQSGAPDAVFGDPVDSHTAEFLGAAIFVPARLREGRAESALGSLDIRCDHSAGGVDRVMAPDPAGTAQGRRHMPPDAPPRSSPSARTAPTSRSTCGSRENRPA